MKKVILILTSLMLLSGCGNSDSGNFSGPGRFFSSIFGSSKFHKPSISGKAGEVVVVMGKNGWQGDLGGAVRETLAGDCPYLPQSEPLYTLVNVSPDGFADLFKIHRNIVLFEIGPSKADSASVHFLKNVWAEPQCVVKIVAPNQAGAMAAFKSKGKEIVSAIEQAERDRVISNSSLYEERSLAPIVRERFGGSPVFPTGYSLKKKTDNFVWIADEKQYSIQGVFVYSYPAEATDALTLDNIIAHRNEVLKENVPGMFEGTYMTTSPVIVPIMEHVKYKGRKFTQVHGWWEVENDYMGGPFVSHSFYSKDGKRIIVTESFVYAPKYDKRQYLRQAESILYSWKWQEKTEN